MNNKHLSWNKEINNNFIIASRAYFLHLPDSSNFPRVILKFFLKFAVRMNVISHMSFAKIFPILFIVGPTFLFLIPECLNNSWWCFSSSFSAFKTEEEFLLNLAPFSSRFMVLVLCHPLIIVFDCENLFHPSGDIQESSQFVIRSPSIQVYSFSAVSYHSSILSVHQSNIL